MNKEVTKTRWLLCVLKKEVAQNANGDTYLITQHALVISILLFDANLMEFKHFHESGYKYINDLMVSNDCLILNKVITMIKSR